MTLAEASEFRDQLGKVLFSVNSRTMMLVTMVCDAFGITIEAALSDRRNQPIVYVRQVAMFFLRELTQMTLSEIGTLFPRNGKPRDHGTVLHACRLVRNQIEVDPNSRAKIEEIRTTLTNAGFTP